jgi:hypothetical protein
MEKITKNEITALALSILKDISNREFNINTVSVKESLIDLFPTGGKTYYEKKGWSFTVDGEIVNCLMLFLADGTPVWVGFPSGDDNPRTMYILKNENDEYKVADKQTYLSYHNFDFEKDFERKEFKF